MMSAALRNMSRRCTGVVLRHVLNASAAAAIAALASASVAEPERCATLPSLGETTSKLLSALVSLPPMKKGTVNDELDADMMFEAARVCESGNTAAVLAEGMPPLLKDVGPDTCLL